MMASLGVHANEDLLRKTSSGLRVMLGRDSLEFPTSRSPSGTLQVHQQPHHHHTAETGLFRVNGLLHSCRGAELADGLSRMEEKGYQRYCGDLAGAKSCDWQGVTRGCGGYKSRCMNDAGERSGFREQGG